MRLPSPADSAQVLSAPNMGGSKPPTSKAQKARAKMLTKLPGNKAKMFKKANARRKYENSLWEGVEAQQSGAAPGAQTGSLAVVTSKPSIKLASIAVPSKRKGETNRQAKARVRELVLAD